MKSHLHNVPECSLRECTVETAAEPSRARSSRLIKNSKGERKKPHNHDHAIYYVEWRGYDLCCTEWEKFE